jgi:putative membrane protein
MMWYGAGWMGLFGPLMMVVFWGGVILLAVWAVRAFSGPRSGAHDNALDILKRRLASGEINQDQYEQARKALQG